MRRHQFLPLVSALRPAAVRLALVATVAVSFATGVVAPCAFAQMPIPFASPGQLPAIDAKTQAAVIDSRPANKGIDTRIALASGMHGHPCLLLILDVAYIEVNAHA